MPIVGVHYAVVRCHDHSAFRVADAREFAEGDVALPLVVARPARNRQPGVRHGADGNLSSVQIGDVAVHVGKHEVVAWIDPAAHRLIHLVNILRVHHPPQALEARVPTRHRSVFERQTACPGGVLGDDGTMLRSHDLQSGFVSVARLDDLAPRVRRYPLASAPVLAPVWPIAQLLDV